VIGPSGWPHCIKGRFSAGGLSPGSPSRATCRAESNFWVRCYRTPYLLDRINYLADPAYAGRFDLNPMHRQVTPAAAESLARQTSAWTGPAG